MDQSVPIQPSATVVLLRDGPRAPEVLLLRRNSALAVHGGAWVFPGGRVDPGDGEGDDAARRAAAREAHEEAGLVVEPSALVPFSHWTTPEGQPRRFSTWFFVGQAGRADVRIDGGEIHEHRWLSAREALDAQRVNEIELPPPTFVTLTCLLAHDTTRDALAAAAARAPFVYRPHVVRIDGGACSLYPDDAGFESRDPHAAGPRHRLLMAPGRWEYLREL